MIYSHDILCTRHKISLYFCNMSYNVQYRFHMIYNVWDVHKICLKLYRWITLCVWVLRGSNSVEVFVRRYTCSQALLLSHTPNIYVSPLVSPKFEHQILPNRAFVFVRACAWVHELACVYMFTCACAFARLRARACYYGCRCVSVCGRRREACSLLWACIKVTTRESWDMAYIVVTIVTLIL
jgi:hypothetical protein